MWGFLRKKAEKPEPKGFSDDDRALSAEVRRLESRRKQLEREIELEDKRRYLELLIKEREEQLRGDAEEEEQPPMSFESILTSIILPQIMGQRLQQASGPTLQQEAGGGVIESMTPIAPQLPLNAGNMDISGIISTINSVPGPVLKTAISAGLQQKGIEREQARKAIKKLMEAV